MPRSMMVQLSETMAQVEQIRGAIMYSDQMLARLDEKAAETIEEEMPAEEAGKG